MCSTPKIPNKSIPHVQPPFSRTILPNKRLGGAFTSYVRRRGEPDGRTSNASDGKITLDHNKTRKSNTLARPGGGESDAAFTPSPPVVQQTENQNIALSLAHQTRIRNLYSQNETKGDNLRPDSSSSASSATDWDNGHATVLRRQTQNQIPPLPPPRTKPLLDLPLYNNLPASMFENSSDSELEKMEAKLFHSKNIYKKTRNPLCTLDKLSVRTELSPTKGSLLNVANNRKPITLPSEETLPSNERLLYFSPNDTPTSPIKPSTSDKDEEVKTETKPTSSTATIHDTILATQLRHINRELTPTISEVYHERNIGLGLAPPLTKLLLNQTSNTPPKTDNSVLEKISIGLLDDYDVKSMECQRCKTENCNCKTSKGNKPWENVDTVQQIQSSDLTTADILEREVKNKRCLR